MDSTFQLVDRVVLVTGGARGLGLAIATEAGALGARVVIADIDAAALTLAAAQLRADRVVTVHADVATPAGVAKMFESAMNLWGRVDHLVCNAGISRTSAIVDMSETEWDEILRVDLKSVFLAIQAAAKIMVKQGGGSIVAISSIGGLRGATGHAHYVAAKAGVIGLMKAAALEFAPMQIRVNAIAPGTIATEMSAAIVGGDEPLREQHLARIPLGRFGEPLDVARTAVFLLSDAASWITGQVLSVNGGAYL